MSNTTVFPDRAGRTHLPTISSGFTEVGNVREVNEDAYLIRDDIALWAVADGMGGHSAGDYASGTVIDYLDKVRAWKDPRSLLLEIVARVEDANATLRAEADRRGGAVIGSTLVCLVMLADRALISWIGDSRVYRLSRGGLERLTRDHSYVQELVDAGRLDPERAEEHPNAHVLTRAIGVEGEAKMEFETVRIERGDVFLLCSDGLSRYVPEEEIAEMLTYLHSPDRMCAALRNRALERGGADNVTAVAVRYGVGRI